VADIRFLGQIVTLEPQYGTFDTTLDDKSRVVIPAGVREWYKGELWMTLGMQTCVWIMLPEEWKQLQEDIENGSASLTEEEYEDLKYKYIYPAKSTEIDEKSGRIPVPGPIRTYARLVKDCLVISATRHLEIWDSETFYDYLETKRSRIQDTTNRLNTKFFRSKKEKYA
jgi:MraZ protein